MPNSNYDNTPTSRFEEDMRAIIDGTPFPTRPPKSKMEELLEELNDLIKEGGGGGGGTSTIAWKPTVAADGTISWVRTASETKPEDQNIKGPKGDTGETGAKGDTGETGPQGPKGDDGDDGDPGLGIKLVTINQQGHLIITFDDDTTQDAGAIPVGGGAVDSVNGQTGAVVLDAEDVGALPDNTTIPTKTSDLNNDSGFQTASDVATAISGKVDTSAVGTTVASLTDGKVPASQLPSYVDDVIEAEDVMHFPVTGESGKIYVALDTNKTYRWSGSGYVEISESLALGETSSTAYAGNKGKANADAIDAIKDGTTIDSFSDVESALADKVDKVSGKGLSTNDYSNTDKAIVDGVTSALALKADKTEIPTKISDLTNDSDFVETSSTAGLLKNDGTVDTTSYATSASVSAITDGQSIDSFSDVETALAGKADTSDLTSYVQKSQTAGLLKNDGTVDTNTYAQSSQLPSVATSSAVGLVKPDGSSITVDANGVLTAVGGSGNTKLKTRYSVTYSSWSSAVNSDGYYTYSLTLSPTLDTTVSPDVLIAGSSNTSQPTDTHKTMFSYVERCYLSGSSLTLYAKTKPTSDFYIWVEGVAGSGSGSIVGNVIQPNGASGGGGIPYIDDMTAPQFADNNRFTLERGGYKIEENICYINMSLKMIFDLTSTLPDGDYRRLYSPWYTGVTFLPIPKLNSASLELLIVEKDNTQKRMPISIGQAYCIRNPNENYSDLYIASIVNLTGTTSDIYYIIRGSYDIA